MGDFRRLLNYVRPFWTSFLFALIAMFVTAVFETATAALLHLGTLGSIRTQTARAFDAAEMQKILGLMPK